VNGQSQQVGSSILAIEANVIIAGLEGIALGWILYASWTAHDIVPTINFDPNWSPAAYAIDGVYSLLAVVIVGFAIEALSGILETSARCRWWGKNRGSDSERSNDKFAGQQQNGDGNRGHAWPHPHTPG
jgi:hypothetical protein